MKNANQQLNDLLDDPTLLDNRFTGYYLFESARITECSLRVIGWDGTMGLAQSTRGYTVAFTIIGDAKPLAKRDFRPELNVNVIDIDTVANGEGVIIGALGESWGRGWRVVA